MCGHVDASGVRCCLSWASQPLEDHEHQHYSGLTESTWHLKLGIFSVAWKRGIKEAGGIKIANELTLKYGDNPILSRWAQCNPKDP